MGMAFSLKESKTRLLSYANMGIGLVLIFWILMVVRDLVSLPLKQRTRAWEPQKRTEGVIPKRMFQDYGIILEKNPFGFPGGALKMISPSSPSEQEPVSEINATLIGTVSGSEKRNFAIFSDQNGHHEVFGVGDSVFGMGRLDQVKKDGAVIMRNGRRVEIRLIDTTSLKELSSPNVAVADLSTAVQPVGSESYVLNREMLQRAIENPNQIMTQARLLPYVVEGSVQGFVLSEVRPGGIYESLGLLEGDVLVGINGNEISTPESALQAFLALKGTDLVQLDVLRDGTPVTLTYQIR